MSYKTPNTLTPCFGIGNYKAKPIIVFLCDDLHISSKIVSEHDQEISATSHYRR